MIDLHTHSIFSDGELIPAELIRRAQSFGYEALAITDHVDQSNIDLVIPRVVKATQKIQPFVSTVLIPGVEITHVPPALIPDLVKEAYSIGAKLVVVHGETIVEPVLEGTNRAAIEAGVDILAHPGIITYDDLLYAKEKGIFLEISARKGHSLSNGYVAKWALEMTVPLVINTDAHSPSDLITLEKAKKILCASGIDRTLIPQIIQNSHILVEKIVRR
ncbi:MAG: histidinol phosphate phosphatase domain-containing protein [Thermodesulfovibrionales bacterium]|nr:histidinol phosphate phosphatase domain-containing protein [Thermodesulfovibrionales bacterium]